MNEMYRVWYHSLADPPPDSLQMKKKEEKKKSKMKKKKAQDRKAEMLVTEVELL